MIKTLLSEIKEEYRAGWFDAFRAEGYRPTNDKPCSSLIAVEEGTVKVLRMLRLRAMFTLPNDSLLDNLTSSLKLAEEIAECRRVTTHYEPIIKSFVNTYINSGELLP